MVGYRTQECRKNILMETLAAGQILDAVVVRLEQYGAWIESGDRDGLILIPEISWSRIRHPGEVLKVGQLVTVQILHVGSDGKFSASLRAMHPELNPWRDPSLFAVGSRFCSRVVRVLDYGCFVELRPEVWGLLQRERWSRAYQVGDLVDVRVEYVEPKPRKVEVREAHPSG